MWLWFVHRNVPFCIAVIHSFLLPLSSSPSSSSTVIAIVWQRNSEWKRNVVSARHRQWHLSLPLHRYDRPTHSKKHRNVLYAIKLELFVPSVAIVCRSFRTRRFGAAFYFVHFLPPLARIGDSVHESAFVKRIVSIKYLRLHLHTIPKSTTQTLCSAIECNCLEFSRRRRWRNNRRRAPHHTTN